MANLLISVNLVHAVTKNLADSLTQYSFAHGFVFYSAKSDISKKIIERLQATWANFDHRIKSLMLSVFKQVVSDEISTHRELVTMMSA